MSNFKSNYSELLLLANKNIVFQNEEKNLSFELVPMSLENILFNNELNMFINLIDMELPDLQKILDGYEVKSHYDFIHVILSLAEKREEAVEMASDILLGLQIIIPDVHFTNRQLQINDSYLSEELFESIAEVISNILGKKRKITFEDSDDEMTRRMKESQMRIQQIKSKGRSMNDQSKTNLQDILVAILYEFPQYKLADLFQMNIYTFYYLFKFVGRIANYEVSKIAAGNGLTKKHKYFIDK